MNQGDEPRRDLGLDVSDSTSGSNASAALSRRSAFKLGVAGAVAGALALSGGRGEPARAADNDPLTLGVDNTATTGTTLLIDNADPNTTDQVEGLTVELKRGFTALYGIAGSGVYGAVRAKNTGSGPGLEAEGTDGPAIVAGTGSPDSAAIYASGETTQAVVRATNSGAGPGITGRSDSGPGVLGVGNATSAGVAAENASGGPALTVNGPAQFNGPVDFGAGLQLAGLAGSAIIPRGKRSVAIANPKITASSIILLTPLGNPMAFYGNGMIRVMLSYERRPGVGFTIYVEAAPPMGNLEVSYFIAQY